MITLSHIVGAILGMVAMFGGYIALYEYTQRGTGPRFDATTTADLPLAARYYGTTHRIRPATSAADFMAAISNLDADGGNMIRFEAGHHVGPFVDPEAGEPFDSDDWADEWEEVDGPLIMDPDR